MSLGQRSAGSAADVISLDERLNWRHNPRVDLLLRVLRIFGHNRPAVIGAVLLAGFAVVAAFAPLIAPYPPLKADLCFACVYQPPTWDHIGGTDLLGARCPEPHDIRRPNRLAGRARRDRRRHLRSACRPGCSPATWAASLMNC